MPALRVALTCFSLASLLSPGCQNSATAASPGDPEPRATAVSRTREEKRHLFEVQTSAFCGKCHPDIYREHLDNTHGQAFTDPEARLATNDFTVPDCIICHTPRPTFVTGMGQNPLRRFHNLEEGNTCMTCHQRAGFDYSRFRGGEECKTSFDPRVGSVEACGTCHRNHGTPYQWAESPIGGKADRPCVECHMKTELRPPAIGAEPRFVRTHLFPASKNEAHLRTAYEWNPEVRGNEAVVTISNVGAGHNLPTELRQRSLQSFIVVPDDDGNEVLNDRLVFRDPYKRPYGFKLQTNTQIPSGATRDHRLPLPIASGTIEASLYFKIYFPAEDDDPHLSRLLERQTIRFSGVTPQPVEPNRHPAPPTPTVDLPKGSDEKAIRDLLAILQFPVPEAAKAAKDRMVEIGAPVVPYLVEQLGIWDQKSWRAAQDVLVRIGKPSIPAVLAALDSTDLYTRFHAREVLARLGVREAIPKLVSALHRPDVDDVVSAEMALGSLRAREAAPDLRALLDHDDPDVIAWAAKALARILDREAATALRRALDDAYFPETRIDLAIALGDLGDPSGIAVLVEMLRHRDAILRTYASEALVRQTGHYFGFLPYGDPKDREAAALRFDAWWAESKASFRPLPPPADVPVAVRARADDLALNLGGSDLKPRDPDYDARAIPEIAALGDSALFSLIDGMRYAEGFVDKRREICKLLGRIHRPEAVPALCQALHDGATEVNIEALRALREIAFVEALGDVRSFEARIRAALYNGWTYPDLTTDAILKEIALTRDALRDPEAPAMWIELLRSPHTDVRKVAIAALRPRAGEDFGFDANADPSTTDAAVGRAVAWWEAARRVAAPSRN